MAIIRWNPWSLDRLLEDDFDLPTIPGLSRLTGQNINIYETADAVIAEVAVPGIPEDKIDVTVEDGVVRISGSYEDTQEDKGQRRYFMSTLATSFNYAFRLPQGIMKDEEPQCELDNGVLRMTFPKVEKQAPQKIKVERRKNGNDKSVSAKESKGKS